MISYIVTPTKSIPEGLKKYTSTQNPKQMMLNGFVNRINAKLQWCLVPSEMSCALGFIWQLTQEHKKQAKDIKFQSQIGSLHIVDNSLVIGAKQVELYAEGYTKQNIHKVLEQIGGKNTMALNIFLNSFPSEKQFNHQFSEAMYKAIKDEIDPPSTTSTYEKVVSQSHAKSLLGENLFQLPKYNKETGNWSEIKEFVELPFAKK